jgi:hypothetical protein
MSLADFKEEKILLTNYFTVSTKSVCFKGGGAGRAVSILRRARGLAVTSPTLLLKHLIPAEVL